MIKGIRIVLSLTVCFMLIGALGSAPRAQTAPGIPVNYTENRSANGETVGLKNMDTAAATRPGYTREQMKSAKSLDLVSLKASDLSSISVDFSSGTPIMKSGKMPDQAKQAEMKAAHPEAWAAIEDRQSLDQPTGLTPSLSSTYGTKNTFTGYLGNYFSPMGYNYYPYSTVGQLFFTDGVSVYACTATLIAEYTIVTAGHCVYNTDSNYWYYNWEFIPGYYDGYDPLGYYTDYTPWILTAWMNSKTSSKGMRYDVAVIILYGDPGYYAGWASWSANMGTKQEIHAIGYPQNKTGGWYTWICAAEDFGKGTDVEGWAAIMTYGSSGGPWFLGFLPYQFSYPYTAYGNYVNGVVSGGVVGIPTFYGPRFSSKNIIPLCFVGGC